MLAASARDFFSAHAPVAALRKLRDAGNPLGYSQRLAADGGIGLKRIA